MHHAELPTARLFVSVSATWAVSADDDALNPFASSHAVGQ
jgi:hypothetical protein